jgi:hypothetical protein
MEVSAAYINGCIGVDLPAEKARCRCCALLCLPLLAACLPVHPRFECLLVFTSR